MLETSQRPVTQADLADALSHHYVRATIGTGNGGTTTFTGGQSFSVVPLDTVDYDTAGGFDTATHFYTIPITGVWLVNAFVRVTDGTPSRSIGFGVDKVTADSPTFAWDITNDGQGARHTEIYANAAFFNQGDRVRLFIYCDSGASTPFANAAMTLSLLNPA